MKLTQFTLIMLIAFLTTVAHAEMVLIVHPSNSSSIDTKTVKNIFLGKSKKFSDGAAAIAVNLPEDDAARDIFNEQYLGKNQSQLNSYWARLEFSGKALPPEEKAADELVAWISQNKEGIGYVDASKTNGSVKIIKN